MNLIKFTKTFLFITVSLFASINIVYAQSCNNLKEIFENSDYCDKSEVSIHGKVYEVLNPLTIEGTKYVYAFQITDDGEYIMKVVSKDKLFFVKDDEVIVSGKYYKKYEDIVASGKDIKVILTGEDYTDLLVNYVGRNMFENETLRKRNIIFVALIPFFSAGTFVVGLYWYRRKRYKGVSFEGCVENLFAKNEWRIEQNNTFRKLKRWVESYSNPDFVFVHRKTGKRLAAECKYKNSLPKEYDRIIWASEDQIENYQNFSQKQNIPVFVILGVGGRAKNPKRVFLLSLSQIKYPDVKIDYLEKFERDPKKHFSLDSCGDLI